MRLRHLFVPTMLLALLATRPSSGWMGATTPVCMKPSAATVAAARVALLKAYKPSAKGYSLVEQFSGCTAVAGAVVRATFESGSGHAMGVSLTLDRLDRVGANWDATRIELMKGKGSTAKWAGESSAGVRVLRTAPIASSVDAATDFANTVLDVTLSEKQPTGFGGGWGSSGDFYAVVTLVGGNTIDRRFSGYHGSSGQMTYLPIEVALEKLLETIPEKSLSPSSFDAAARAIFVERFLAEVPWFDHPDHWWVREAFLSSAGDAGDASLLPRLHEYARRSGGKHSEERSRVQAINAIVGLTGDDRRYDKKGNERPLDDVGKDYGSKPAKKP